MRPRIRRLLNELGYLRAKDQPQPTGTRPIKYSAGRCYVKRGGQWVEVEMSYPPGMETR